VIQDTLSCSALFNQCLGSWHGKWIKLEMVPDRPSCPAASLLQMRWMLLRRCGKLPRSLK
jgi:hypothetical protein